MDIMKIGIIGVVGVLLALQLRTSKPEYSVYISLVTGLVIMYYVLSKVGVILETILTIQNYVSINTAYINTLLKIIGITYTSEFSSSICRDAGYQTVAGQIEIFSKLAILAISMPILMAVLDTIHGLLGG